MAEQKNEDEDIFRGDRYFIISPYKVGDKIFDFLKKNYEVDIVKKSDYKLVILRNQKDEDLGS